MGITAGNRLRIWRKENNITLKEMSERIGISQPSLTQFETDKISLSEKNLTELGINYGISIDWLLTGRTVDISEKYKELMDIYDQISPAQQKHLIEIARTFLPKKNPSDS